MAAAVSSLAIVSLAAQGSGAVPGAAKSKALVSVTGAPDRCPDARRAIAYYRSRYNDWRRKMGVPTAEVRGTVGRCPLWLAERWRAKARAARKVYERWWEYHWHWQAWLPDKWARIGACETGYGRRPGNWRHSNSSYEGAFGFAKSSWDAFKYRADPKAGPYPEDAWQATPRQQYEVALAIWRAYGFSGWGCRGA